MTSSARLTIVRSLTLAYTLLVIRFLGLHRGENARRAGARERGSVRARGATGSRSRGDDQQRSGNLERPIGPLRRSQRAHSDDEPRAFRPGADARGGRRSTLCRATGRDRPSVARSAPPTSLDPRWNPGDLLRHRGPGAEHVCSGSGGIVGYPLAQPGCTGIASSWDAGTTLRCAADNARDPRRAALDRLRVRAVTSAAGARAT